MFENSNVQQQRLQVSRAGQASSRRSLVTSNPSLGMGAVDSSSSSSTGGQQRLKNALNLGKAVGAKVNDLLRRKEPNHLGDIGVTEVNKNVGAVWNCMDGGTTANSHASLESFPRLEPPPPTGKKRLPRALKTTQDMMISSDPVVNLPDTAESSFASSPDKTPFVNGEEPPVEVGGEGAQNGGTTARELSSAPDLKVNETKDEEMQTNGITKTDEVIGNHTEESGKGDLDMDLTQLQLSVPDLIHKDHQDPRSKPCDPRHKASGADTRLASTPCKGKAPYRISLSEDTLMDNGASHRRSSEVDTEELEKHPDLLSFE